MTLSAGRAQAHDAYSDAESHPLKLVSYPVAAARFAVGRLRTQPLACPPPPPGFHLRPPPTRVRRAGALSAEPVRRAAGFLPAARLRRIAVPPAERPGARARGLTARRPSGLRRGSR